MTLEENAGPFKDPAGDVAAAEAIFKSAAAMEQANLRGPNRVRKEGLDQTLAGIAICGSHPETKMQAPFDDDGWLIYACSPDNVLQERLPRVDQWFEIHMPIQDKSRPYSYLRYLESLPLVWMRDTSAKPHFAGARFYPETEMKQRFCPYLFTSSIAFMMAKAIVDCELLGIPRIALFGILQRSQAEYAYQRSGTQYFLWEAARRGIEVYTHEKSQLFEPPPEIF